MSQPVTLLCVSKCLLYSGHSRGRVHTCLFISRNLSSAPAVCQPSSPGADVSDRHRQRTGIVVPQVAYLQSLLLVKSYLQPQNKCPRCPVVPCVHTCTPDQCPRRPPNCVCVDMCTSDQCLRCPPGCVWTCAEWQTLEFPTADTPH